MDLSDVPDPEEDVHVSTGRYLRWQGHNPGADNSC